MTNPYLEYLGAKFREAAKAGSAEAEVFRGAVCKILGPMTPEEEAHYFAVPEDPKPVNAASKK